ncbi:hypothetical protein [Porphyromonas somerae]|uniref:hypothetical protein n=2 Tax=Porphyromonadaceae TaxID=171551 RepID=UPI002A8098DF|nr:hypothetical protein [Porphyromonas somerae]
MWNYQKEKGMCMKSLITKTGLVLILLLCSVRGYAQLQADPFVAAALTYASETEKKALDNISKEQNSIVKAQTVMNIELDKIRTLQKRTYDYLTNISAAVENAKDIKKSYEYTVKIYKLCGELKSAISANPQGLVTTVVGTKQISDLTSEMTSLYSYVTGITLNKKTLLNSAERLIITGQVVHRLQNIHFKLYTLVYSVYALSFKDLPRLLAPDIYYSTISKKDIAQSIINSW